MRVLRGQAPTVAADRRASKTAIERVDEEGTALLRVWRPPRQVAFGRRDSNHAGYARARQIARERDIPAVDRSTGGRAVFFTGDTVSFLHAIPIETSRSGIETRYEQTSRIVQRALSDLGVDTHEGEPDGAFCPGTHSLSATGKIVGLAQRVHREVAVVAGIIVVCDHDEIATVLAPIYEALDIPFDRDATGSIARAGGPESPEKILSAIESAFVKGEKTVERV